MPKLTVSAIRSASCASRRCTSSGVAPRSASVASVRIAGIAAGDVEAHAHHRHRVLVRGDTTDRHDVAHVSVGHERHLPRPLGDLCQLRLRILVVRPEHLHVASEVVACDTMNG
jgi:hypothetical protein